MTAVEPRLAWADAVTSRLYEPPTAPHPTSRPVVVHLDDHRDHDGLTREPIALPPVRLTRRGALLLLAACAAALAGALLLGQARQQSWCRHHPTQAAQVCPTTGGTR